MIRGRDKPKNPLKQAQYGPRKFDAPTWPGVIFLGAFSALLAWFDVLGWRALYKDHAGEALTLVAIFCEFGALLFALYMTWRIRHDKKAGWALIFAFVACSAFNVFGGVQSTQLAMEPIEKDRWVKAQFELDAKRAVATQTLADLKAMLPKECAPELPWQSACNVNYTAALAAAEKRGDVRRYNAAADKLAALPERAVVEPVLPPWAAWVAFSAFALVSLAGPWMVGFGRPDLDADNSSATDPQAPLKPIPDETSPPDGLRSPPSAAVTPQEVEQNVPPPVPNPWPPTSYIEGGAAEVVTPEARAEKLLRAGKSKRSVAAETGLTRYAVGELAKVIEGKAA